MAEMTRVLRRLGWRILAVLAAVKSGVCAALPVAAFALAALAVQTVAFAPEAFANACTDKGWPYSPGAGQGECRIITKEITNNNRRRIYCNLFGNTLPVCRGIFGSNANIPQRPGNSSPEYVFNCGSGKVPSGVNTFGATKCCPTGQVATPGTGNACVNADADWLEEIQKARGSADAAKVARLLSAGGTNPDATIDGVPALIVAATIGHAEIVSILITAGAAATARLSISNSDTRAVPHIAVINDFGSPPLYYSWETALNVLRHFADAVKQSGATYDWTSLGAGFRAIEHFEHRYVRNDPNDPTKDALWHEESVADKQRAMLRMANILLAQGDSCRASVVATVANHITCKGPLLAEVEKAHGAADPSAIIPYLDEGDLDGTDSSNRPLLIVAARQGHAKIVSILITAGAKSTVTDPSFHNVNAAIHAATPLTDPGPSSRAARASVLYHFGAALDVVGDTSFDWSYEDSNNNTVLDVLALAEDKNPRPAGEDAGILYQMADYVAAEGGTCNNAASARRICSGPCALRQGVRADKTCGPCPALQGVRLNGICGSCTLIGATNINSVCTCPAGEGIENGACAVCRASGRVIVEGACVCPAGASVENGVCACPAGQGVRADKTCGVCPVGHGLQDGFCAACPSGHIVENHVCVVACPVGQALQDGVCAACPVGQGSLNGVCVSCIPGASVENGVCACPAGQVPRRGACGGCPGDQVIAINGHCVSDSLTATDRRYIAELEENEANFASFDPMSAAAFAAMIRAIRERAAGNPDYYSFVSAYDTGGASYNRNRYSDIVEEADSIYSRGFGAFQANRDNQLAAILLTITAFPAEAASCRSAGWVFSLGGGGSCGVPLTLPGGAVSNQCHVSGSASPQCSEVFGSTVNYFPAPVTSSAGATLRFAYNCDPAGNGGIIPATINTIRATECACTAPGQGFVKTREGATCVPDAIVVDAQKCADAGRELSAADGGSCAAAITLSGGTLYSKCHFSEGDSPQCADVFGAGLEFPDASVDGPFIYNCDPGGTSGLVPATSNTVGATACACPAGEEFFRDRCVDPPHEELIEAVQAVEPNLAVIRALLDQGARANITLAGGLPLVFSAATLFHAEVVSVLVTAGADPETRHGVVDANEQVDIGAPISASIPEHILAYGTLHVGKAQVMIHFADAARIVAATSTVSVAFQWDDPARFAGGLFVLAEQAYMESGPAGREEMSFIGGYLLDQGAQCDGVTQGTAAHTALCLSRRSCALAASSVTVVSSCGVCAGNPLRSGEGDSCVPACGGGQFAGEAAGWGERQCQCADGEGLIGGSCVLSTVAAEARLCAAAGWSVSPDGGGTCGIPVTVSGEGGSPRCHLTDSDSPQCSAVFGATVNYFPAAVTSSIGVTLGFVYDCDPEGGRGLIPATVNTVGATACVCANAEQSVRRGVCQCPVGEGVVADGTCDTCPNGQGIRSDGTCGVCPVGQSIVGAVCLPGAVMNQCVTVGWSFSADDGGSCGVLLTVAGGESVDRCYVSGELDPQCEDVFGGTVNYFPAPTLAADGATLRFVYDCDPKGENGLIPATANTILATECGCFGDTAARGGGCVPLSGDLGTLSDKVLCGAFGGTVRIATGAGGSGEVCSGMDKNDTFCIMDAAEVDGVRAFPCRGLFKHLRRCNLKFNRPALNPFFCGERCGEEEAMGAGCK